MFVHYPAAAGLFYERRTPVSKVPRSKGKGSKRKEKERKKKRECAVWKRQVGAFATKKLLGRR